MKTLIALLLSVILFACYEKSTEPIDSVESYNTQGDAGLILVVETNFELDAYTELLFKFYKEETLDILSDMFGVEKSKMDKMTMSEIVEVYGEDWQIKEIIKVAKSKYKEIKVLTDDSGTVADFKNAIAEFAEKGYYIDMVFSLHASSDKQISFIDRSPYVEEITGFLKQNNYFIRSLYQTCCYGSYFFEEWTNAGMYALNGSVKSNGINIFSPVYFVQEWVGNGLPFDDAIQKSFDREIEKLKTYSNVLPIEDFFLQTLTLENSKMLTSGLNNKLLWNQFPVKRNNKKHGV